MGGKNTIFGAVRFWNMQQSWKLLDFQTMARIRAIDLINKRFWVRPISGGGD